AVGYREARLQAGVVVQLLPGREPFIAVRRAVRTGAEAVPIDVPRVGFQARPVLEVLLAGTSHRLPRAIGAGHALPVVALGRGGQDGNTAGVAGNLLHDPVLHAGDQVEGGGREPCSGGQAGSTKWSAQTAAASPCDFTPRKDAAPAARRSGSPSPCQSTNPGGYTATPRSDRALRYGTTILRVCGAWPQERATTNSASVRAPSCSVKPS